MYKYVQTPTKTQSESVLSSETAPKAFGIPLSQVIANDHAYKRRQDAVKESRRDCLDLEATILRFRAEKQKMFFNGTKAPGPESVEPIIDPHHKPLSPTFLDNSGRGHRRVRFQKPNLD